MSKKNIVFDIVGSLVSHEYLFDAIEERFGAEKLRAANLNARLLGACWIETAEREYTYLSLSGRYKPFFVLFEALFYRMLHYAGVPNPREFASEEDVKYLIQSWRKLKMRPDAAEAIAKLRAAGFTVWCVTAADIERVQGYFTVGGVDMPAANLISCDSTGVAKPQPGAYQPLLKRLLAESGGAAPWFAAAHMWDVSTARTLGYRGAYCTVLEDEPMQEIFGDMDVVAPTLSKMVDMVIAQTP